MKHFNSRLLALAAACTILILSPQGGLAKPKPAKSKQSSLMEERVKSAAKGASRSCRVLQGALFEDVRNRRGDDPDGDVLGDMLGTLMESAGECTYESGALCYQLFDITVFNDTEVHVLARAMHVLRRSPRLRNWVMRTGIESVRDCEGGDEVLAAIGERILDALDELDAAVGKTLPCKVDRQSKKISFVDRWSGQGSFCDDEVEALGLSATAQWLLRREIIDDIKRSTLRRYATEMIGHRRRD